MKKNLLPRMGEPPQVPAWQPLLEALPPDQQAALREQFQLLEQSLTQQQETQAAALQQAEQRAGFYLQAANPQTGCRNPHLAWMAAQSEQAFTPQGSPDWDTLRTRYPELFQPSQPQVPSQAHAGQGGAQPSLAQGMNAQIRAAAGRR